MNDNDLERILRRGSGRVDIPADVADRVQTDMHQELDRTLGTHDTVVVSLHSPPLSPTPRPRFLVRVAAAMLLVAALAGLVLAQREPNINETDLAQEVSSPPPPQPYLVACLDFIDAATIDERPWHDVLAGSVATIPPEDLATLATAIDKLLATSPQARTATSQLQTAALEARSVDPDPDLIMRQLESAQDILIEETFVPCLTAPDPVQSSE